MPDKVTSGIFKFDENVACTTPLSPKKSSRNTKPKDVVQDKDTLMDNPFFFQ
tara:strand:- start:195 stop:350 length:156 start_codon:yes stop_codon:yes gene_type:complete